VTYLMSHLYRRAIIAWIIATAGTAVVLTAGSLAVGSVMSAGGVATCIREIATYSPPTVSAPPKGQTPSESPSGDTTGPICTSAAEAALSTFQTWINVNTGIAIVVPLLVGMFIGAPLIAREVETGTIKLAWAQSLTPFAWFAWKSGAAIAVGVIVCTCCAAATLTAARLGAVPWSGSPWPGYDLTPILEAAYGLLAVVIGIGFSTVIGRSIPAIAASAALWSGLRAVLMILVRPNLMPPELARGMTAGSAGPNWFLSITYVDASGHELSQDQVSSIVGSGTLESHGISMAGLYQGPERFWAFQSIEAGIVIALACIVFAAAAMWLRYRLDGR